MTSGVLPDLGVEMRRQLGRGYAVKFGDEPLDGRLRAFHVFASDVQLDAIARRDDGGFTV